MIEHNNPMQYVTPPANPNIRVLMDQLKLALGYDSGQLSGDDEMRALLKEAIRVLNQTKGAQELGRSL